MADDDGFKQEVDAIGGVLAALSPLSGPARERVVSYVLNALDITSPRLASAAVKDPTVERRDDDALIVVHAQERIQDIRSLREAKQPQTANQMAALVGYYVGELAPDEERRDTIDASDVERYFKTAPYPLPSKLSNTLPNAAAAGYFDAVGNGKYRLNPVGHNLVVHGLPAGDAATSPARRRVVKKKAPAKNAATAKKLATKGAAPSKKAAPRKSPAKAAAKRTS